MAKKLLAALVIAVVALGLSWESLQHALGDREIDSPASSVAVVDTEPDASSRSNDSPSTKSTEATKSRTGDPNDASAEPADEPEQELRFAMARGIVRELRVADCGPASFVWSGARQRSS